MNTLNFNEPYVKRADAIILEAIETPGAETLIELYAGRLWEYGMELSDAGDELSQRYAYITLLLAINKVPTIAPADTLEVAAAFVTDDMAEFIEAWASLHTEPAADTTPALDAQVRPLLAWLDA